MDYETISKYISYCPESGDFFRIKVPKNDRVSRVGRIENKPRADGYVCIGFMGKYYKAHRVAYLLMTGEFPENLIDHQDGNKMNNKWSNIRPATTTENQRNRKLRSGNKSGVSGVSWVEKRKRWIVRIGDKSKVVFIGRYKTLFDAACARKSAENHLGYHKNHGRAE